MRKKLLELFIKKINQSEFRVEKLIKEKIEYMSNGKNMIFCFMLFYECK